MDSTELWWLTVRGDGTQVWYSDYDEAKRDAKDTLGTLYEVQRIADYGEQEL